MALTTEEVGRMMSYALQGYSFEVWVESQHIAQEDQAHARVLWDDTVATQARAVAQGGEVRLVSSLCSCICAPEPRMAPSRQGAGPFVLVRGLFDGRADRI